jgi:hypothetical protein
MNRGLIGHIITIDDDSGGGGADGLPCMINASAVRGSDVEIHKYMLTRDHRSLTHDIKARAHLANPDILGYNTVALGNGMRARWDGV